MITARAGVVAATQLAEAIENYLVEHPAAALLEDGRVVFDMLTARYSVAESHGRCLLQIWNEERNLIRTVVEVRERARCLCLVTRRMGAARPQLLELVPSGDRRTPTARDTARRNYQRLLERVLARAFPGAKVDGFRSAMDLEHSFGPAYARGRLLRGNAADAVIGIGAAESGAAIDGILTLGILWLEHCREKAAARRHFGGLKVVVPTGAWRATGERMAWLNHAAAEFTLYTLDERSEEFVEVNFHDLGNLESRLVHSFSRGAVLERCQSGIRRILSLLPLGAQNRVEIHPNSATEAGVSLHGLEFARVRRWASSTSFACAEEITFGAGLNETPLTEETEPLFVKLAQRLFASRHPDGNHIDPLYRMQPERWLESVMRGGLAELLPDLRQDLIYSQVPALSSGERGMLDLLTLDRAGRLTVLELKADEDLHLPVQALDYWIRVRALNDDRAADDKGRLVSAFERQGYFTASEVSPLAPRLLLVAPALRIHPANEPVLRYFSPRIEWELVAVGEHWRRDLKVVFRKHGNQDSSQRL